MNPPSPPAAPTSPVTPPTRAGSVTLATSAKVAPLPDPRAAAMARNATVPMCSSSGVVAATAAPTTTTAYPPTSTGIGPNLSREPATDRSHHHGHHHEASHPVRRVRRVERVGGLQVRREVHRERHVTTEATAYRMQACHVIGNLALAESRLINDPVGAVRPGASRRTSQEAT